jgi:SAM-dependent methyltransferase
MSPKRVLNVGGNNKSIPLPPQYTGFEHLLLDIDPKGAPDICCDARKLGTLDAAQFDAIYCSHNLEHYYRHDVAAVLSGFRHVLKDGGFIQIRVPDMGEVFRRVVEGGLDIDDTLYQSAAGPIMALDVIYGFQLQIERSGQEFFAHKTGFTQKSLLMALQRAGFTQVYSSVGNLEVQAVAFKGQPSPETLALWGLKPEAAAVAGVQAEAKVVAEVVA